MNYIDFSNGQSVDTLLLIDKHLLNKNPVENGYPLGTPFAAVGLETGTGKKVTAAIMNDYLTKELIPFMVTSNVKYLVCANAEYFKKLTGVKKAEPHYGSVLPCTFKGLEFCHVVYVANYKRFTYADTYRNFTNLSIKSYQEHRANNFVPIGSNVLDKCLFPTKLAEIKRLLDEYLLEPEIASDIEAFSLKHHSAGIGTIAFAKSTEEGFGFPVDAYAAPEYRFEYHEKDEVKLALGYLKQGRNEAVRKLLKEFFTKYEGKIYWHNAGYDVYNLVYQLWMNDLEDWEGLNEGLSVMARHMEDTQLLTYLATNNCVENKLSLKDQTKEFLGNYAQEDINDIRRIPLHELVQYNVKDALGTIFTKEKHTPTVIADNQMDYYRNCFLPWLKDLIHTQLVGLRLNQSKVIKAERQLKRAMREARRLVNRHPLTKQYVLETKIRLAQEYNDSHKVKRKDPEDIDYQLNLNSNAQVARLLYGTMKLPVIETTDSGEPATGGKVLKALKNHTDSESIKEVIDAIKAYSDAVKIATSFIKAFKRSPVRDGLYYLYGSFKLGGTKSGRLSSSNVNLQNLPSTGSRYAKLIKGCFTAPKGFLFIGFDFASLEDRISALQTKDKNKLKVYTDGYDGHALRAHAYFPEQLGYIPMTPEAINDIENNHKDLRQESKAPTFALTYQGTWMTLVKNCGFSDEKAKRIEAAFQELYADSIEWVNNKLQEASQRGYVELAFGLRLRTPALHKSILGLSVTPKEVEAEGRTAGNALGQGYGTLNNRAVGEILDAVRSRANLATTVLPSAQIHDANYWFVKDDLDTLKEINDIIGTAMKWQELPEIAHDEVKLSGSMELYVPSWADKISIPNDVSKQEIIEILYTTQTERESKDEVH